MAIVAADIRIHANPDSLTDQEITSIITAAQTEILTKTCSTDATNAFIVQAIIHSAAAIVLKRARAKGELAEVVHTPESRIQNSAIDSEIKQHEKDRDQYISLYSQSVNSIFTSPSFNAGFSGHYSHRHHHHGGH